MLISFLLQAFAFVGTMEYLRSVMAFLPASLRAYGEAKVSFRRIEVIIKIHTENNTNVHLTNAPYMKADVLLGNKHSCFLLKMVILEINLSIYNYLWEFIVFFLFVFFFFFLGGGGVFRSKGPSFLL